MNDYWTKVQDGTLAAMQFKVLMALDEYLLAMQGDIDFTALDDPYCQFYARLARDIHLTMDEIRARRKAS